jgi:hypothetical protein
MAQAASESGFGRKVGTVIDNGWERGHRSSEEARTAGSEGTHASFDRARQSREAFSASLQESEAHRQMWEQSRSGQLGASVQLQDHFIQDFLLPKLDFNYERLQGILGDPYRLRPYLDEYTAGNYDRMLGELAGGVQGGEAVRARHVADRSRVPGAGAVGSAAGGYLGEVQGRAGRAGVPAQGRPSDQTMHTAMREFSTNAQELRERQQGSAEAHREEATAVGFGKLKPVSPVGKGAAVVEEVGNAAERVVDGLTGEHPGQYVRETLAGKNKQ